MSENELNTGRLRHKGKLTKNEEEREIVKERAIKKGDTSVNIFESSKLYIVEIHKTHNLYRSFKKTKLN